MAKTTWILNAQIITQDSERHCFRGSIRIEGNRIAAITRSAPRNIPKDVQKIDASRWTLIPGFVQAHVHLCQTLFRNQADDLELLDWLSHRIWPFEAAHDEETLHASALLGIHELLSSGTTCILDMATVRHTRAIFEAVKKTGIRANVGKCLMDHPETTPPTLREKTAPALKEAQDLFEHWNGLEDDRIRVSFAPRFVISCTEMLLREIRNLSQQNRALIHTHASENLKEVQFVKELVNCENVEYLHELGLTSPQLVLAHCIWLRPHEFQILKNTQTHVVHCPSSNMKLASGFAQIPEMLQSGINVALGADGAPCNNNLNIFQEMRMAALIHKPGGGPRAVRSQEVFDMATLGGAKALQWDEIGSIEVGKKADLVALDLNCPENQIHVDKPTPENLVSSIVYSCQPQHVRQTWVDGRTLYKNNGTSGRVSTIPLASLTTALNKAQKQIHRRVETR